jgi:hypothetical protein
MTFNPRSMSYIFDDTIEYKELELHPVRMRDYFIFHAVAECLMLEKNSIRDPIEAMKAIQMTYLEYLFYVDKDKRLIGLFVGLLALVTGNKNNESFEIHYGKDNSGMPFFRIGETVYNSQDFDALKGIISEQNMLDLPDETIQKDVREKMEETRRFKERIGKSKVAGLEDQMIALSLYSGMELYKIYDMSIRKFFLSIRRANHMVMSNIYLTASMSGMVTFKDKSVLKGWLADLENEDKYSDVTIGLDSMKDKISGADAIKK